MKKILAIVLALLVILSMTACANSTMKATEPTEKESDIIEDAFVSEAGLDNMFVVVSDIDQTELLIIYNGADVTEEVLNAD